MEPSKKKLKLDIINLNYKFQNLTLKRKNDIIDSDEIKNKKVKIEMKRKHEIDKNEIHKKVKIELKRKYEIDKNEIHKKVKLDIKKETDNADIKLEFKSCSQEYSKYHKEKEHDPDNDPDNESFKEYKRLPPYDMIYRYII